MKIIGISALCILTAIVSKLCERENRVLSSVLTVSAVCMLMLAAVNMLNPVITLIDDLQASAGIDIRYSEILFKSLGVCYVTQLSSDCCRDCGENALANSAELIGKISVVLISVPLLSACVGIINSLLG